MHARFTSRMFGFRSMLSAVWLVCGVWLIVFATRHGHLQVAIWLMVYTVALIVVTNNLKLLGHIKPRLLQRVAAFTLGMLMGFTSLSYLTVSVGTAFPLTAGESLDLSFSMLLTIFAVGLWTSPTIQRLGFRLEEAATRVACQAAVDCVIDYVDDMSKQTFDGICYNYAHKQLKQWSMIVLGLVILTVPAFSVVLDPSWTIMNVASLLATFSLFAWVERYLVRAWDDLDTSVSIVIS